MRQTAEGVVVDVDASRPGSFASDAYNGGCPSSVERRRRACAAIDRVTPDRRVAEFLARGALMRTTRRWRRRRGLFVFVML